MTAAITASGGARIGQTITFSGSGFSAAAQYELTISSPSGQTHPTVTTDGSGNFTLTYVVQEGGAHVCAARPVTEVLRTSTAAATSATIVADGKGK